MRKCLIYCIIAFLALSFFNFAKAEDKIKKPVFSESTSVFNEGFANQKAVTDSKLKKTIDMMKERSLTKKQQKLKKEVQPLSPLADEEHLKSITESFAGDDDDMTQTLTVMIPVSAYNDNGEWINPGYYKLSCHKVAENDYILELSQGTKVIITVKAKQTNTDLNQDSITFCNSEIIENQRIRLMYGTINLNLVGYLYFK